LPADSYAANSDFYIWAALFAVLLTFGLETAFFRFYNTEDKKDALVSTSFISLLITVISFVIVIAIFFDYFEVFFDFENNPLRLKLFVGILALDTIAMIPFAYLRVTNRPIRYAIIKLVNVGVIVVINLIFLKFIPTFLEEGKTLPAIIANNYFLIDKVNYIFIANLVGSALSFMLLVPYLLKFKIHFDVNLLKKMLLYSWPIMVAGLAYVINENLDKFLIKRMIGDTEMGIYSACYKLAIFMNLYILAFRLGAEPFFFNNASKKNAKTTYATIMNYFVIIGALFLIGIVAFIDLLKHFINPDYWGALAIVPIVLLANLFLGIYYNLGIWYKLTDKTIYGMYFSIFGAFITIVLNLWLIPTIGIMAAAYATLIAYFSMTLVSYLIGKKHYPVPYNIVKMSIYLTASILICYLSFNYFRNNYLMSFIFVILFGILIYFNERKELAVILKRK
jgi:O-antigen/teichoic acid export membrane protein